MYNNNNNKKELICNLISFNFNFELSNGKRKMLKLTHLNPDKSCVDSFKMSFDNLWDYFIFFVMQIVW